MLPWGMDEGPIADFSVDRRANVLGGDDGYDVWFDVPPKPGDATTSELQTLLQGSMLVGHVAAKLQWDWPTTIRLMGHLAAPLDGFLLFEVDGEVFYGARFRAALNAGVVASGLDPYKVRVSDTSRGDIYILGHGLPLN